MGHSLLRSTVKIKVKIIFSDSAYCIKKHILISRSTKMTRINYVRLQW